MAKDKTKPRPELAAKREAIRQQQAVARAKRRRRLALNWLIAIVIIGLVVSGITFVVLHVKAGARELLAQGPDNVTQITPPHATSDGLAVLANPGVTLASDAIRVDIHVDLQSGDAVNAMQYYGPSLASLAAEGKIELYVHLHSSQDATYKNTASTRGAEAAACADTVGAFITYLQAAFNSASLAPSANQIGFTDAQLQGQFPAAIGLTGADLRSFKTCYSQRATYDFVTAMDAANQTAAVPDNPDYATGVLATPVFLANYASVDIADDINAATSQTKSEADTWALLEDAASQMSLS